MGPTSNDCWYVACMRENACLVYTHACYRIFQIADSDRATCAPLFHVRGAMQTDRETRVYACMMHIAREDTDTDTDTDTRH